MRNWNTRRGRKNRVEENFEIMWLRIFTNEHHKHGDSRHIVFTFRKAKKSRGDASLYRIETKNHSDVSLETTQARRVEWNICSAERLAAVLELYIRRDHPSRVEDQHLLRQAEFEGVHHSTLALQVILKGVTRGRENDVGWTLRSLWRKEEKGMAEGEKSNDFLFPVLTVSNGWLLSKMAVCCECSMGVNGWI